MTDGPHYYNGAKFTVRMDVGYEVCCSEGNFKDATINAKIEYSKFGWKKVIYVFHTQEYLDIIDPLN